MHRRPFPNARAWGALFTVLTIAAPALAATPAVDVASQAAYDDGWDTNDDGGAGWLGGWSFSISPSNAGVAIGSSTINGDGDTDGDGDIDTGGKSFLLVTSGAGALVQAVRTLDGPLSLGQEIALSMDNDPASGEPGFRLSSPSGLRYEFRYSPFAGTYQSQDAAGYTPLGIPGTDEGLRIAFRTTSADTYELRVTGASGASVTYTGTLLGAGGITSLALRAQGEDASIRAHAFNLIAVPEPGGAAAAVAAFVALAAVRRRAPGR